MNDEIEVAMNPTPDKSPVAYVHSSKYIDYKLDPDLPMGERCRQLLKEAGFNAKGNTKFDWIHNTVSDPTSSWINLGTLENGNTDSEISI